MGGSKGRRWMVVRDWRSEPDTHIHTMMGKSPVEVYLMPNITKIVITKTKNSIFKGGREASDITSRYDNHCRVQTL